MASTTTISGRLSPAKVVPSFFSVMGSSSSQRLKVFLMTSTLIVVSAVL